MEEVRKWWVFLSVLLLVAGLAVNAYAAEYIIKYAHGDPPDPIKGPAHGDALIFKYYAEERSGGRIEVEIYPSSELGSERELLEGVQLGSIEVCNVSEGSVAGFFPEIMCLAVPYMFRSEHIAWEVLDGPVVAELMEEMRKQTGVRCLKVSENGFRNFTNTVRPIRKPEDMAGLKFRTMEHPAHMKMVESMGASPTPIAWGELYTALQMGVVDGQENPVCLIEVMKFYEVQKYLTMDGHIYSIDFTFINDDFFQSLPEDLQQIVLDAAIMAGLVHRGMQIWTSATGVDRLREEGMEVYFPTTEELEAFRAKAGPPVEKWIREEIGDYWVDKIIAEVERAEEKYRVGSGKWPMW
jgi:C4-dicarboxylate-binding protein DctP